MEVSFSLQLGLPPYGPSAIGFPQKWGELGREGIVVEFCTPKGIWYGNFQPGGIGGVSEVRFLPNSEAIVVFADGDCWLVSPAQRSAALLLPGVFEYLEWNRPPSLIVNCQGIALAMLDNTGIRWHTRRLSLDGIRSLKICGTSVLGEAWFPDDSWHNFTVDLMSGRSQGGWPSSGDNECEQIAIDL